MRVKIITLDEIRKYNFILSPQYYFNKDKLKGINDVKIKTKSRTKK